MNITIQDFKPFKGKSSIKLKPVTIFIGKNNAGKTSLTDFIDLQINSKDFNLEERFLNMLSSPSISQLVNYHKWKYVPQEINDLLSNFDNKLIKKLIGNPEYSDVQIRTIQYLILNEQQYYDDKKDIKIASLDFSIQNVSKAAAKTFISQKKHILPKSKEVQQERKNMFLAFQKLCSYDPNMFYEFINSNELLEQKMLHSTSIQVSGGSIEQKIEYGKNIAISEVKKELRHISDKKSFETGLKMIKYLNKKDNLRLHTIIDSLKPYYSSGLMFNYELSADTGSSVSNDMLQTMEPISNKTFEKIIERMYLGQNVLGDIENDAIIATLIGQKKPKRSFKNSTFYKKYCNGERSFFNEIFNFLNKRDQIFKNNLTMPVNMKSNINDKETNHFFTSKNRLFDGLRIDAPISKRDPAKMYFEYGSEMYESNKLFVKNLLKKTAPSFFEMCEKDLDAIFHNHDKYYYENPKHKFFKIPGTAVYRKIGRRQMQFNLDIINEHHSSVDNLPYKCSNIVDSKETNKFPFKQVPIISADKFINGIFIQHRSGHQNFQEDLIRGMRVYVHNRVSTFKNDVDCINSYNKMDPTSFLENRFNYDTNKNKVFFRPNSENPFSTPDLVDTPDRLKDSNRESNIMNLIGIMVDIYEAESEFIQPELASKRYVQRSVKSTTFLQDREKFVIGAALSSSISKIFEILHEDFLEQYALYMLGFANFVSRDGYGRRVQRRLSSNIIDSANLPGGSKNQYLNIKKLNELFGNSFESVVNSENILNRLLARVNNALKSVEIPYSVRIDKNEPTIRRRVVGDTLYVISLEELSENNKIVHVSDFSMVGEGTRSIVTLLMQIELQRLTKGAFPCFLTIREFENHLHPSLVGRFFRFLINRTRGTNINLIIETHSEIILRTLQTIVKKTTDTIEEESLGADKVAIYYVEKVDSGNSEIRELILDKSGYFDDEKGSKLPPDFFDINSKLTRELLKD